MKGFQERTNEKGYWRRGEEVDGEKRGGVWVGSEETISSVCVVDILRGRHSRFTTEDTLPRNRRRGAHDGVTTGEKWGEMGSSAVGRGKSLKELGRKGRGREHWEL